MSNELRKWADEAQFEAAPMQAHYDEKTGVLPKVHLVWMTPDPLGAIASACRMYEGKPTYSLEDISDEERLHYWNQSQATHLKAPLEFVNFHFFIEGVDRAFTHQMVRQRTAVYAQESMRFAVMGGNFREGTSLPPSLHGTVHSENYEDEAEFATEEQRWRTTWDDALMVIEDAYTRLVESGMPAEEARGLLPHAMATRLNYHTNLRNLLDHAGNRLCTQAQFHWRLVFAQIAQAIRGYGDKATMDFHGHWSEGWQFDKISSVFRPVCYELGRCPFQASFDRHCSIRERVQLFAEHGVSSDKWHHDHALVDDRLYDLDTGEPLPAEPEEGFPGIQPEEWATDPTAARAR